MKESVFFELKKSDKKSGEDRYETTDGRFVMYIMNPQFISRKEGGEPKPTLTVTFESDY